MFTGIIDHCGIIDQIKILPRAIQFSIQHQFPDLTLGESIAVDGICLTVTDASPHFFKCDISPETLKVTTAAQFKTSQTVNLERALQPTSRMGGHFVMGHIDQTAKIKTIRPIDDFIEMIITELDDHYLIKKGSITINGVSLTINQITEEGISLMLIPHTLERTNLKNLREHDRVNIEFDILTRIIVEKIRA